VEGPTDDPAVNALRARQKRNFLATLILSQGVPMICGGDEMGRTQGGNNNAYCQDNEISWLDWEAAAGEEDLVAFTRMLIRLRQQHPVFHRRHFFQGRSIREAEDGKDLTWFEASGREMSDEDWQAPHVRSLMVRLSGEGLEETDDQGERLVDDTFLLLLNADDDDVTFLLPAAGPDGPWRRILNTGEGHAGPPSPIGGDSLTLRARSLALLRTERPRPDDIPGSP
jgi:glycogen operon protein